MNRKIDALVAEHVMKLDVGGNYEALPPYPYSTDIGAAWEVVMKTGILERYMLWDMGENCVRRWELGDLNEEGCWVEFAEADTAPMAICLAALKAKGVKYDNHEG